MENTLKAAAEAVGYEYKDLSLLHHALVHRSYANEHNEKDNERMEFLGDSVLSIIVSDHIFHRMSGRTEGDLSKMRAAIVCEQSLANAAARFGLGDHILLGKGEGRTGGRKRPSIVSDAFEAVIASIYLDGGIEAAREWVLRRLAREIEDAMSGGDFGDYKTALQEKVQKGDKGHVTYEIIAENGMDHEKRFEAAVSIDGERKATGAGRSKKEAEQQAAKNAMDGIDEEL